MLNMADFFIVSSEGRRLVKNSTAFLCKKYNSLKKFKAKCVVAVGKTRTPKGGALETSPSDTLEVDAAPWIEASSGIAPWDFVLGDDLDVALDTLIEAYNDFRHAG